MRFNVREWRRIYDMVHRKNRMLNDSRPTYDEQRKIIPPVCELGKDIQDKLEQEIESLLRKNDAYLNACGMFMPEAPWKYDAKDQTTWPSHASFKYQHLLEKRL